MDIRDVETELAETPPQKGKGPWPLILIVVAITALAIWLVPGTETEEPQPTVQQTPPSLLDDTPGTTTAIETVEEAVVDTRPGAKARALIAEMRASGTLDLERIFAAATQAQQAGELPDAYLLYFFAAREGHAEAALTLGQQADPANHSDGTSVFATPDIVQAHKWYTAAAEAGSAAGRDGLAALRTRVEGMAEGGDPEAERLTLLWQ